ncbi:MAG: DUF2974 domain-containing protein, partial [Oscillospiraceae bacterium]|nr:DUF2974 domain-containing protein [Oscillospiraceae bacterium]
MSYTDKEIQITAQISYINISKNDIYKYFEKNNEYPTLKYLLNNNESMLEEFYKMFYLGYSEEESSEGIDYVLTEKLNKERERIAKSDIESLKKGEFSCSEWKVVDVWDYNDNIGIYGILFETPDNKAVVAFRGSELLRDDAGNQLYLDWIAADFGLLDCIETDQQKSAREFINYISENYDYDEYVITGHSLGGNLASHATITANSKIADKITQCYNWDGPGFSNEYIEKNASRISDMAPRINHYQWSIVGSLLHMMEEYGEKYYSVDVVYFVKESNNIGVGFEKHDINFVLMENEKVVHTNMGAAERITGEVTRIIDNNSNDNSAMVANLYEHILNMNEQEKNLALNVSSALLYGIANIISAHPEFTAVTAVLVGLSAIDFIFNDSKVLNTLADLKNDISKLLEDIFHEEITYGLDYDELFCGDNIKDVIYAGDGDDNIIGNDGNDFLYGEAGNDTIDGGAGDDIIVGGDHDDTLYGSSGNDVLIGDIGNDILDGGIGDNRLYGGLGNDTYVYRKNCGNTIISDAFGKNKILFEDLNADGMYVIFPENSVDAELHIISTKKIITFRNFRKSHIYHNFILEFSNGETLNVNQEGSPFLNVVGTEKDDKNIIAFFENSTIDALDGNDTVHGSEGTDIINGGLGEDTIYAGNGDDIINGGFDNDKIYAGKGMDTVHGGYNDDLIYGGSGNDELYGDRGNDFINGNEGNDVIDGGSGTNTLLGGDNSDRYIFKTEAEYLYGNCDGYSNLRVDQVYDRYGLNVIEFIELTPEDIELSYTDNTMTFVLKETNEKVSLTSYPVTGDNFCYKFGDAYYSIKNDGEKPEFCEEEYHDIYVRYLSSGNFESGAAEFRKKITDKNIKDYTSATKAQPPRDPLVIDINKDGKIDLLAVDEPKNHAYFDLDKNGFAEKTAWIGENDGFLVYDRNGNGIIDDSGELFSDQVVLNNGSLSGNGFKALEDLNDYTEDRRNVINEKDSSFDSLKVWIDKGTDGKSEGELVSLKELGIKEISLNHKKSEKSADDKTGTVVTDIAEVVYNDGSKTSISEHWFVVQTSDTQEVDVSGNSGDSIENSTFGNMMSLGKAIESDKSGKLNKLLESFNESEDYYEKRVIAKKIIYFITGAGDIDPLSRGGNIDARDLYIIETIMGVESFIGADGGKTPNSNAAPILKRMYSQFENMYFSMLNEKSNTMADYINSINEIPGGNNDIKLDLSSVKNRLRTEMQSGKDIKETVLGIASFIKTYDDAMNTGYLREFKNDFADYSKLIDNSLSLTVVIGDSGDNNLNGTTSNELFWADGGNDVINASGGNDVIITGTGNNTVNAGAGNDEINGSFGNDTISGEAGNDIIYASDGKNTVNGGEGDDRIYTGNGTDTIRGGDGNDIIESGAGDDIIYGEADNDIIDAGEGNDKIYGGAGNDDMNGGAGDDTFYIGANHGDDIIRDSEGHTTVVFEDELSESDCRYSVDISGGFVLVNKETEERIS